MTKMFPFLQIIINLGSQGSLGFRKILEIANTHLSSLAYYKQMVFLQTDSEPLCQLRTSRQSSYFSA